MRANTSFRAGQRSDLGFNLSKPTNVGIDGTFPAVFSFGLPGAPGLAVFETWDSTNQSPLGFWDNFR
jgi:hypothetical protein